MSENIIGTQIAILRKQKGVKQDELAKAIRVSTQAVSKWENGGTPDVYLLPQIADFFGVSIDCLFGRDGGEVSDAFENMAKILRTLPSDKKFKKAFEYCWDIERAMFGTTVVKNNVEFFEENVTPDDEHYSSLVCDHGFTRMGLANRIQYFLLVPEIKDKNKALFDGIDYPALFELLADRDVFETLVFLNKRDAGKGFTEKLVVERLGLSEDKVRQIFAALKGYKLINDKEIEGDDGFMTVYMFYPTPSLTALLIFAREIIDKPHVFSCQMDNRKKPYFE